MATFFESEQLLPSNIGSGGACDALVLVDDMEARGLAHDAGYAAAIAACARERMSSRLLLLLLRHRLTPTQI